MAVEESNEGDGSAIVQSLCGTLCSEHIPLALRFRALFSLKHIASAQPASEDTLPAIRAIAAAFSTSSSLLKHELAYCLGQSSNRACSPYLRDRLEDADEVVICRHEAAEALAALEDYDSLELLKTIRDTKEESSVLRETCELAVARLEWLQSADGTRHRSCRSDFTSIDPAPSLSAEAETYSVAELEATLLDTTLPLFPRYRAMFTLRNLCSPPDLPTAVTAVHALSKGFRDPSALFRHEIAFVFGQLSHPASIPSLVETLKNQSEEGMVRHEAAEALGSLGAQNDVDTVLKQFLDDPEDVVRESVVVALDMAEFEKTGEREYALLPDIIEKPNIAAQAAMA